MDVAPVTRPRPPRRRLPTTDPTLPVLHRPSCPDPSATSSVPDPATPAAGHTGGSRPERPLARWRLVAGAVLLALGCAPESAGEAGGEGITGGTVVVAAAAEPATLAPPLAVGGEALPIVAQLFDRLAEPGDSLTVVGDRGFRPRLATAWSWAPDSLALSFRLDPRARWHDGRPVRAGDVAFSFRLYTDARTASPVAPLLADLDSVSAPDSLTATVWFKRRSPQQFFDATYHLFVLPEHLLARVPPGQLATSAFGRAPVGTGRFRFAGWERGRELALTAERDHWRGRALLDRVTWRFAPDFGTATITLLAGEADFLENLRAEYLGQMTRARALRIVPLPALDYGFLQFNLRAADGSGAPHPVLADRELRRALTLAVDRERVVRAVFDTLAEVAVGPVPRALLPEWRQLRPLPHDVGRARTLLDSLGWVDGDGDGVRERLGVPLAFGVLVPASSTVRQRLATLLQEQLRGVGAQVTVERAELGAFTERLQSRRFDAAVNGWRVDLNPGIVRQTWGTLGARTRGGANYGGYESVAFDRQVDSATSTLDPARSRTHWVRAYQAALDDAPAIWLFEPRLVAGAHRRLRLVGMRADAWWAGLADWWIPLSERIGRDRIGGR